MHPFAPLMALMALVALEACQAGGSEARKSTEPADEGAAQLADVQAVTAKGGDGAWTAAVTILSHDSGCDRYANWWEVLTPEGDLVYRRILMHSHVDEQPFTRSGGPIEVAGDTTVIVRAHMSPGGYGGKAMRGTFNGSFAEATDITASFAPQVATRDPQPDGCGW